MLLAACTSVPHLPELPPEPPAEPAQPVPRAASASEFERRLQEQALLQASQSRLAEAALSWEILSALRPDDPGYRTRLAETRRLIGFQVLGHLERGAQALKRGALDEAERHHLAALALQPDNAAAADALRELERERTRRQVLGRPARLLVWPRSAKLPKPVAGAASAPGPVGDD